MKYNYIPGQTSDWRKNIFCFDMNNFNFIGLWSDLYMKFEIQIYHMWNLYMNNFLNLDIGFLPFIFKIKKMEIEFQKYKLIKRK